MKIMKAKYYFIIVATMASVALTSCDKVSPAGVLMAGTAVEDRVKMSQMFYKDYLQDASNDIIVPASEKGGHPYSFLIGSDSHITTDPGRINEMFEIGLENDDMLYCHLGDIADTKPEYYITINSNV